jgi:hypothetical protein
VRTFSWSAMVRKAAKRFTESWSVHAWSVCSHKQEREGGGGGGELQLQKTLFKRPAFSGRSGARNTSISFICTYQRSLCGRGALRGPEKGPIPGEGQEIWGLGHVRDVERRVLTAEHKHPCAWPTQIEKQQFLTEHITRTCLCGSVSVRVYTCSCALVLGFSS